MLIGTAARPHSAAGTVFMVNSCDPCRIRRSMRYERIASRSVVHPAEAAAASVGEAGSRSAAIVAVVRHGELCVRLN
jgi:hypothetical protein